MGVAGGVVVVVMEVVVVAEVVVVSFGRAFQAQRMDRSKLTLEESKEKWHCCPPSRFVDSGNSQAAAWHPTPEKSFCFSQSCGDRSVEDGTPDADCFREGKWVSFIKFPQSRETPLS